MLTIEQIVDKDKRRGRAKLCRSDVYMHQERVRMHADTSIRMSDRNVAMRNFLGMVDGILPSYKADMFRKLLTPPYPTTSLTSTIFDRLSRIFEGRNPVFNYQFTKSEYADNWEWYRQEVLDEPNIWKTKAWDYFRTEPNSVLVVDMPVARLADGDKYLQPYFYWVTFENIVDYGTNEKGDIEWIIYKNDERKRYYAVDDTYYRSFPYGEDGGIAIEGMTENRHTLGYCPATWFIEQPVSLSMPDVKKSPITDVLSDLDWYLFFITSEKHLNIYASYPIYSGYESVCDYKEEIEVDGVRAIHHCDHGVLVDEDGKPVIDYTTGRQRQCPHCNGGGEHLGAGTMMRIPVPDVDGGIPDMIEAVKMLGVDKKSLDFNAEKVKSIENSIVNKCVGTEGDVFTEFSISEKQVDANYESQSTILIRVKKVFENAQWFVDSTICKLRYGKESVKGVEINYGTEFYTLNTEKLRDRYKKAKESGANQSDLLSLRKQIVETEYRTNPLNMQRMLILSDVEPYDGLSITEVVEMLDKGLVDEQLVKVKINFASLIARFERENENIIDFGAGIEYRDKIEKIKKALLKYVEPETSNRTDSRGVHGETD